jgi:histidine ammonia-lyase
MLIRANTLAIGHSGLRPEIVETLIAMLNAGVTPVVPEQGSLGSSGDLAPLCHLALVFSKGDSDREEDSGFAMCNGQRMTGKAAMDAAGLPRVTLGAKESLALINGATFSAAVAALAAADAANLIRNSEIATALALEALLGVSHAFDERIHAARRHAGQAEVAARLRALISGSSFVDAAGRVQDAYSLRCAPQVIGPALDTLRFVERWIENEINAATDNPLIFEEKQHPERSGVRPSTSLHSALDARAAHDSPPSAAEWGSKGADASLLKMKAISGGNFHGEVMGFAMDFLGIALAEVGALAERQINRMLSGSDNQGLPPMLVSSPEAAGLNSGLMMPHYTAVSLALENQTLAHPDSVHSLPTSAGQEDHNANSLTAARHARQIIYNVGHILAVHFFTAAQAIDLRRAATPGAALAPATAAAHAAIRRAAAFVERDRLYQPDLERLFEMLMTGEIARAAEPQAGT